MKKLLWIFLFGVGALGATAASADISRKDARTLLERSGLAEQVMNSDASLQSRLDGVLKQVPEPVPARWVNRMEAMFRSLVDPQLMLEQLELGLAEVLSPSDFIALSDFYESPLARRIVPLEGSASTPAAWNRIEEAFDALEARLDRNPVREDLLGRLDRARRYSEVGAALAAASFVGFMQGAMTAVGKEAENLYEIEFANSRVLFLDKLRYENAIPLIYAYGPITDNEIERYLAFLHTPAAKKFYDTVERVQMRYCIEAGAKFAGAVTEFMGGLIGKTPTTADEAATAADDTSREEADETAATADVNSRDAVDKTPTAADETPKTAEVTQNATRELLERSGGGQLLAGYAANRELNAGTVPYALDFESVHPDIADEFVGLFRQWVDAESLIALAEHGLSASLSQDDLDALNAFYTSPLGERVVALEVAATTQQAMNRVREESAAISAQLADDPVRGMLLGELDRILRKSEADVSLAAVIYASVGKAFERPADHGTSFDDVFETARRDFIKDVRAQEILSLEYTYGPLTDDEILEYLRFLKTDSAKSFHILLESTLTVYFGEHGKTFAEALGKVALEHKSAQ